MSKELQSLLDKLGVRPNKALGQNFLADPSAAAAIAAELEVTPEDVVVEIGAGLGALTDHITGKVKRLLIVEFDRKLAAYLTERFADDSSVEVYCEDAARFDPRPLFALGPIKMIGNLPYSCGTAILSQFLDPPSPVVEAVFMLQREVIDRLSAKPRTKSYGRLTATVGAMWKVENLRSLPPEPFYPRPAIDSSVVRLTRRPPEERGPFDWRIFDRLLRSGFAQRRKQLKRRLPLGDEDWPGACAELGLSETARAEELSIDDWIELARYVDPHPLKDLPQSAEELFDVVDDADEVIGQEPRAKVHAEGLKHRAVHILVFNPKGELFLQKRSSLKDSAPGKWDSSAAGHLDVGEGYLECAIRELDEELGVSAEVTEICGIGACRETGWEFVRLYVAEHRGPFTWPASEIETGAFFATEMVAEWVANRPQDFASGFLRCWQQWQGSDDAARRGYSASRENLPG